MLGGLSWFNFRKNTPAAVQARQAGQLAKFKAQQRATYQALLNQQREEFERQADEVRRELSRATDRQQGNSVLSRYKRALKSLEEGGPRSGPSIRRSRTSCYGWSSSTGNRCWTGTWLSTTFVRATFPGSVLP
ncbi:hypothetical protein ACFSC4_15925 [Deinococcus malanensis]|uniref:hypothetical protein n=1 Tax=Deinococcus malanensis TaxID=1706855 RepID=UPI00363FDBEB